VVRVVLWGKVSRAGARTDYGVVVAGADDAPQADAAASDTLRDELREARGPDESRPFFDRGPGYATLAAGATSADVDWMTT
jgi:N-methylhydantoinase B